MKKSAAPQNVAGHKKSNSQPKTKMRRGLIVSAILMIVGILTPVVAYGIVYREQIQDYYYCINSDNSIIYPGDYAWSGLSCECRSVKEPCYRMKGSGVDVCPVEVNATSYFATDDFATDVWHNMPSVRWLIIGIVLYALGVLVLAWCCIQDIKIRYGQMAFNRTKRLVCWVRRYSEIVVGVTLIMFGVVTFLGLYYYCCRNAPHMLIPGTVLGVSACIIGIISIVRYCLRVGRLK